MGGASNADYGWFGGGAPSKTNVDRIDFSNDTAALSARGPLNRGIDYPAATGNIDFGYWVSGQAYGGTPYSSRVERHDYSNDTVMASIRGSLIHTIAYPVGVSGGVNALPQIGA